VDDGEGIKDTPSAHVRGGGGPQLAPPLTLVY